MTKLALPLVSLLPLRALTVTLEFIESSTPRFFHQAALTAFLRFLAGSPDGYDKLIRLDAPESGCVRYRRGDHYRFVLVGLAGSDALLDHLFAKLAKLPEGAPRGGKANDHKVPFRDNVRLVSIQDFFDKRELHSLQDACLYDMDDLEQEAALWQQQDSFRLQWLSPVKLLKEKAAREGLKDEARFARDADDLSAELLLSRLYTNVSTLIREREGLNRLPSAGELPRLELQAVHAFWLDSSYADAKGKNKASGGMAGVMRCVSPEPLPTDWWQLLILGQYLGIGQNTTFGWGRYTLISNEGGFSYRAVYALNSLLMLAKDEENLLSAWRHVVTGRDVPDDLIDDDDEPYSARLDEEAEADGSDTLEGTLTDAPLERLQTDLDKMLFGQYEAPALRGYLIPKSDGGIRPLAIPPLYDRVLQRAVQQVLTPAFEQLMYSQSHGYRPGRSRMTASEAIKKAWRDGYQWVYEGDVRDFFDSVSWETLRERLEAFYFHDPVVDAVLNWMGASVQYKDTMLERHQGLPQGSPLSPLMANLILDDFDRDMQQQGFHLIRFADDFVVLCKDPQAAKRAQQAAQKSLQEHGLDIHPDKERLAGMDDGFRYLGYLFVKDMALDISGQKKATPNSPPPVYPKHSWMAELGQREAEHARSSTRLAAIVDTLQKQQAIFCGERENSGALVTVSGSPAILSTLNRQLHVYRDGKKLHQVPWNQLEAVLLLGNHQITTQAMHAALNADVQIHFSTGTGYYKGCVTHNRNSQHQATWMRQILVFQEEDKSLYCAREVVVARIRHMKEVLRQRKQTKGLTAMENSLRKAANAESLASLRGYEGSATREYYQRIAQILPAEIGFIGRNRRPPRDPFNVLLSLGYTQVYALTESLIHTSGLLPWQGFYHQARGKHAVLASDLMEPFRHLVERTALKVILREEISADDFSYTDDNACRITNKARRKFIALLMDQWSMSIKGRGQDEAQSWTEQLRQQVLSLKNFITKGEPFQAFKQR